MTTQTPTQTNTSTRSHTRTSASRQPCPECGGTLHRSHRTVIDRLISFVRPVRRYRCSQCGWSGLLRSHSKGDRRVSGLKTLQVLMAVAVVVLTVAVAVMLSR